MYPRSTLQAGGERFLMTFDCKSNKITIWEHWKRVVRKFTQKLLPQFHNRSFFQVSSTLQVSGSAVETLCNISSDLTHVGYDSSLEDLNRELEKFCPYNESLMSNVANSRFYCDIFSRQSIESGENSSPDFDDENRVNFQADIPDTGCEIIVPKRPSAAIPTTAANYQPCTNVQILKSSCSAFRDIAEMKVLRSMSEEEQKAVVASTSKTDEKEDSDVASSLAH